MKINFFKNFKEKNFSREYVRKHERGKNFLRILKKIYSKYYSLLQNKKIPGILSFFSWEIIDFYRFIRDRKIRKPHLYGIYGFFGLWGQGKTISMVEELYQLRKDYGDDIYIFTNFGFKLEDSEFDNWRMLLDEYDKSAVFAWDEIQNEFTSRDFKNFPTELLTMLTQNRKGNGIRIYYTSQRFSRVDKIFRELTYICYECKTHFNRLTSCAGYYWEDYEQLFSVKSVDNKLKIHPRKRHIYIQTDFIRNLYDSYKMLESAKSKEYLDRVEQRKLIE